MSSAHRGRPSDAPPEWPKAVTSAALEAAGSSTRGSGWAPSGRSSSWEYRAAQTPPGLPWGGTGAELGQCPDWTLTMLRHLLDSPVEVAHHLFHRVEVVQVAVRDAEPKPLLARREHLPHRKGGVEVRREA